MAVPYTFGTATAAIPLSQVDSNFATTITLGNTAIQLGNTVTTLNNMTLANVTVSSGSVTLTNIAVTTANVTTANIGTAVITGTSTLTGLTASTALALDASKNIVSVTNTGSGNNVLGTSPTIATPTISTITSAAGTALTLQSNNGNTAVTVDTSQNVGIGTASPASRLHTYTASGGNKLTVEAGAASQQAVVSLVTNATTPGQCQLYMGKSGATTNGQVGYDPNSDYMYFYTSNSERMRIDSSGNVLVGTTSSDTSAVGIRLLNNNQLQASKSGDWSFRMGRRDSAGIITEVYYNSSRVGDISTNGSNTTYNSASDYRLKQDIAPMTSALAKVATLKPVTYKWKVDGSDGQGFIAHELAEIVPDAVRGEKDEVDANGKPVYQSIDTSVLVATLTAAIQEQQALITSLTARVAALEAK